MDKPKTLEEYINSLSTEELRQLLFKIYRQPGQAQVYMQPAWAKPQIIGSLDDKFTDPMRSPKQ